ncbi:MAG TPA: carbon-nitrogen hydrolase family protein [Pirellulales bacterium]|nr:carbon-nitrogen hydrolase family protein [Pirellulales bacterium]
MKIAGVQMDVVFGHREANLAKIVERLRETAAAGARLTVFPECSLPGYCFDHLDEAREHAEPVPGPSTLRLAEVCRELSIYAVVGLLETDGPRLFNAAALVGPAGVVGGYRKIHLPYLGVDRFTTPGDRPFGIHAAGDVRVGMSICYDAAFPEAARVLALEGADVIALPTNWPPGAECTADFVINARALENNVYYMAVNRVGSERGFRFIGKSKICDPRGHVLAEAQHEQETVLYAEIDPALARQKHIVRVPGKHEIDRFADRRPAFYGKILEKEAAPAANPRATQRS